MLVTRQLMDHTDCHSRKKQNTMEVNETETVRMESPGLSKWVVEDLWLTLQPGSSETSDSVADSEELI